MAAEQSTGGLLASLSNEMAGAVERAGQAVVTVHGRRRFPASGVVWAGNVVVTADHVLEREEDITLTLPNGEESRATLVGRDPGSDIAVLKAERALPAAAELAPQDSLKVGHFVLAVGRPGGDGPMASFGVVSALGGAWRTARGGRLDAYVRADVALYPGFSGGPLVDVNGAVVGLNSSHLARGQEIAIPAYVVSQVAQALQSQGRVRRAYLGLGSQPVQIPQLLRDRLGLSQESGLMVLWIEQGSPAEQGGLLMGDVLVSLGEQVVRGIEDLQMALSSDTIGKPTRAGVIRGGEHKELSVAPGERA